MNKARLEAFSDGVLAIIITIMVLEIRSPENASFEALLKNSTVFFSYALSYVYVAIYWVNHHHVIHTLKKVTASVLWANLHLLFWVSLMPFVTEYNSENNLAIIPLVVYGIVLFMAGISFDILVRMIIKADGRDHAILAQIRKNAIKSKLSIFFYLVAIGCAFINHILSFSIYVLIALMWVVPNKQIENMLRN